MKPLHPDLVAETSKYWKITGGQPVIMLAVYRFIYGENKAVSVRDIYCGMGETQKAVYACLKRLIKIGLIERISPSIPDKENLPYLWDYWTEKRQIRWLVENGYRSFKYKVVDNFDNFIEILEGFLKRRRGLTTYRKYKVMLEKQNEKILNIAFLIGKIKAN